MVLFYEGLPCEYNYEYSCKLTNHYSSQEPALTLHTSLLVLLVVCIECFVCCVSEP